MGVQKHSDDNLHDVTPVLHGEGPSDLVHVQLRRPIRSVDKKTVANSTN
jgi:hypothetical protein